MTQQSHRVRHTRRMPGVVGGFLALLIGLLNLLRFWIYTAIFFALLAFVSYMIVSREIKGQELAAPDLRGLTVIQALERLNSGELQQAHLSVKLERTQPHESFEKGLIMAQEPEPRRRIKAGVPIRVVVSEGPPLATVPELRGQSRIRAGILLRRNNLAIGNESYMPVSGKPGGIILSTDPPASTGLPEGTKVNLLMTAGETQTSRMPSLTGLTLAEVRDELTQLHLGPADEIAAEGGELAVPGQVHNQFPPPDDPVTPQSKIRVFYQPERQQTADELGAGSEATATAPGPQDDDAADAADGPSIDTSILPAAQLPAEEGEAEPTATSSAHRAGSIPTPAPQLSEDATSDTEEEADSPETADEKAGDTAEQAEPAPPTSSPALPRSEAPAPAPASEKPAGAPAIPTVDLGATN